jgi:hypothetical protein
LLLFNAEYIPELFGGEAAAGEQVRAVHEAVVQLVLEVCDLFSVFAF